MFTGGVPKYNIPSVVFPVAQYFIEDVLQMTRYTSMCVCICVCTGMCALHACLACVHTHVQYCLDTCTCIYSTCVHLSTRYLPPPPSHRGRPAWVRHLKGQREALEKKQQEEQDHADYINSLEAKRKYPSHVIEALRNLDHDQIPVELILELIKVICRGEELGAILVFLPGWDTISKLHDMLRSDPVFRSRQYLIIPLHSLMPTAFQQSVRPFARATVYMYTMGVHLQIYNHVYMYMYICIYMYM